METWVLIMAIYAGGTVRDSLSLPVQLGPMPSMEVCLDVAQAMERAGKGHVMAGCSIQYSISSESSGGAWVPPSVGTGSPCMKCTAPVGGGTCKPC